MVLLAAVVLLLVALVVVLVPTNLELQVRQHRDMTELQTLEAVLETGAAAVVVVLAETVLVVLALVMAVPDKRIA